MSAIELGDDSAAVVVGSGAGGATVAHELCRRGVKVVMLEAGPRISPDEFRNDENHAFQQLTWLDPRLATGNWSAARYAPNLPAFTVKAVGGSTVHWNGLSYRLQAHEFRARTRYGDVPGASLQDWPITLAELDPFYRLAEERLGVTGTHSIPPNAWNNNYKVLYNGAKRVGYQRISNARIAINSVPRDGRPACIQLGFCNQGCKISAKWSTLVSEVPKSEATGNLDLRTESMALELEHDESDRITGVVYADRDGNRHRQRARLVCVAGNAVETPRLLLNSASPRHPHGLGNDSGELGRNYMRHVMALGFASFPLPVNMHRGITTPGAVFDESVHDEKREFAGGYLMQAASLGLPALAGSLDPAGWGREYAEFLSRYDHLAGVLLCGEEMPRRDNRVALHHTEKDRHGLPIPTVHVDEHPMNDRMRAHFHARAAALYDAVGATEYREGVTVAAAHNMGTCRMSEDPKRGVVDRFGRSHRIGNLFVSDGSVFPTSGCENPTLTIVALAIRQARHIAEQLAQREI